MSSRGLVLWLLTLVVLTANKAFSGPIKIHLEGTLVDHEGRLTYDGIYPVTVRLWNGGPNPILTIDTVRIRVLKGKFRTHIGPYVPLTRESFSTQKSLSFQLPKEPETSPRMPFLRMAPSGEIYIPPIRLATSGMPATDPGTRVRLTMTERNKSAIGILLSMNDSRIELMNASTPGLVQKYNFDSVAAFDISARYRHWGEAGLLAGIAAGVAVGYAMGAGEEDDVSMSKETKRAFDAFAGAIIGGLTGYLLGNSISTDRWQSLPLDRVRDRARSGNGLMVRGEK